MILDFSKMSIRISFNLKLYTALKKKNNLECSLCLSSNKQRLLNYRSLFTVAIRVFDNVCFDDRFVQCFILFPCQLSVLRGFLFWQPNLTNTITFVWIIWMFMAVRINSDSGVVFSFDIIKFYKSAFLLTYKNEKKKVVSELDQKRQDLIFHTADLSYKFTNFTHVSDRFFFTFVNKRFMILLSLT